MMPPVTAEEDRLPPRSENQGFRLNCFTFFGNLGTPNPSKFQSSRKFYQILKCCHFFNAVKFRVIFVKIGAKTLEIDSKT